MSTTRRRSDKASENELPFALSEFPALPAPAPASIDDNESASIDADLLQALKESKRFAQGGEDPALARAIEESKEALLEQQRAILVSFEEKARAREEEERLSVQEAEGMPRARRRRRAPIPVDAAEVLRFFHASTVSRCPSSSREPERKPYRRVVNSQSPPRQHQSWEQPPAPNIDASNIGKDAGPASSVRHVVQTEWTPAVAQSSSELSFQLDSRLAVLARNEELLIVIDGEAVGLHYGRGEWKARGVELAVRFFRTNGYECLAIVPAHREDKSEQSCKTALRRIRRYHRNSILIQPSRGTYRIDMLEHAFCATFEGQVVLISNHDFSEEMRLIEDPSIASVLEGFLSRSRVSFEWLGDVLALKEMTSRA